MTARDRLRESERLLTDGELTLQGRILPASNLTFLAEVALDGQTAQCVYKPVAGERPLWDFPNGTLANREVAAYAVSDATGWDVVPPTVLRDGPAGPGMVQLWCEPDEQQVAVDIVPKGRVPRGFCHVLDAYDGDERPVSLVHEDSPALLAMAVFDAVVNNADRKGGHVLAMPDGHRYGVDHGVCFHVEGKLRTVLWGWARDTLLVEHRAVLERLRDDLCTADSLLSARLSGLLTDAEVQALDDRCARILAANVMPTPSGGWPSIPWPAF